MSKGVKYSLIFIIIAIIALAIYVGKQEIKPNNINNTTSNQNVSSNQNVANTTTNTTQNTIENNNVELNIVVTPEKIVASTTLSKEDKAKELAKQKWGGDDGVYFAIDNVNSDETYVVSVRDSATTKVLEWYTVDIKTGKIIN